MITVARITPLADPSPWSSLPLGALVALGVLAAAVVTVLPAGMAIWAKAHRIARRFRQVSREMDAWIEEDAPRPNGPA